MEYTVRKLGKLACISTRALRYYDEICVNLEIIKIIITSPSFDGTNALKEQQEKNT